MRAARDSSGHKSKEHVALQCVWAGHDTKNWVNNQSAENVCDLHKKLTLVVIV
jgi:hypothetical protein